MVSRGLWGESVPSLPGLVKAPSIPCLVSTSLQPLLPLLHVFLLAAVTRALVIRFRIQDSPWIIIELDLERTFKVIQDDLVLRSFILILWAGIILSPNQAAFLSQGLETGLSFDAQLSPLQCPSFV